MVVVVGEDTVALWFCVVAVLHIVAEIGTTFCEGVIIFDEGEIVSICGGGVLIFGFGVTNSSGGGLILPGGGEVIISGGGICIFDGSASIICGGVALFAVVVFVPWLNSSFASAIFVFLFPGCDVAQGGVTFAKSLLMSLCD